MQCMIRHLAAAAALGLALTACGSTGGSADEDPPAGSNADSSETTDAPADDAEGTEDEVEEEESGEVAFGDAFTYDDGLTVKVSKTRPFEPSEWAAATKDPAVAFTVTIVNKTGAPYDPSLFYMTMQSGNREAEQIFDSEKGINGSPTTKILDGRESKFDAAFNVKDPKDLVLQLSPDAGIEYAEIIYTS